MNAVRALVILGSIMQCFALVCSIVKLCVKKEQQKLFKAAGGFALFSGKLNYSHAKTETLPLHENCWYSFSTIGLRERQVTFGWCDARGSQPLNR